MTLPDNGGPAFPADTAYRGGAGGLSVRDYFAGQALPAVIAKPPISMNAIATREEIARSAFKYADAMLAALSPAQEAGPDHSELLREAARTIEQMRVRLHPCDGLLESESATLTKIQEALGDG